jgi:thiol:disulfide interchange protein
VPTIIFLDASGKERTDLRLVGYENAEKFLERLAKAP